MSSTCDKMNVESVEIVSFEYYKKQMMDQFLLKYNTTDQWWTMYGWYVEQKLKELGLVSRIEYLNGVNNTGRNELKWSK
jgi:hypothetical protein